MWEKIESPPRIPSPRTDHTIVSLENGFVVFGGFDGRNRFSDLWCFDLTSLMWKELQPTNLGPTPRFGHSAVVFNSGIFVWGGWDGRKTLDELWRYDLLLSRWDQILPQTGIVPPHRYRHAVGIQGPIMTIFGGVDQDHKRYNDLWRCDLRTGNWSSITTFGTSPAARTFHRGLCVGDHFIITGGYQGEFRLNDTHACYLGPLSPLSLMEIGIVNSTALYVRNAIFYSRAFIKKRPKSQGNAKAFFGLRQ
jgi:hypothetical protein